MSSCASASFFGSALVWLMGLALVEVSMAYPSVGLGFIVSMVLGWWLHRDMLTLTGITGKLLIACGVVVFSRGRVP